MNNREYLLLMKFEGVSAGHMLAQHAEAIDVAYMEAWGQFDAFTIFVLEMDDAPWAFGIRFVGPPDSVDWLKNAISAAAEEDDGSADFLVSEVRKDLTDRFASHAQD